jgi:hypothetical protein
MGSMKTRKGIIKKIKATMGLSLLLLMPLFSRFRSVVKLILDFPTLIPPHRLMGLVLVVPKRLPSRLAILHIVRGIGGFKFTVVHGIILKRVKVCQAIISNRMTTVPMVAKTEIG